MTRLNVNTNLLLLSSLVAVFISCKSQERSSSNTHDDSTYDSATSNTDHESTYDSTTSTLQGSQSEQPTVDNDSTTEFQSFLSRFVSDTATQRSAIDGRLKYSHIDTDAEPEPKTIHKELDISEVTFPVFPLDSTRKQQELLYEIDIYPPNLIVLVLYHPNTDYHIKYHFSRRSKWVLDWVEDLSL